MFAWFGMTLGIGSMLLLCAQTFLWSVHGVWPDLSVMAVLAASIGNQWLAEIPKWVLKLPAGIAMLGAGLGLTVIGSAIDYAIDSLRGRHQRHRFNTLKKA
jgi:hypothetical protein